MRILLTIALLLVASDARGDTQQLAGKVVDTRTGATVSGATVFVAGARGLEHELVTDGRGRYAIRVQPGHYNVIFVFGGSRTSKEVVVGDTGATLDGTVEIDAEVIVVEDPALPVAPKPKNFVPSRALPYSDAAILQDAWTRAWLLLEISPRGDVIRFKFLNRPGYDLEEIATAEAFKLRFEPARGKDGRPARSWIVWNMEWPSNYYLMMLYGTRRMPEMTGLPAHRFDWYIPCKDSGKPWAMDSVYKGYRDCSPPDLSKVNDKRVPWIEAPTKKISSSR